MLHDLHSLLVLSHELGGELAQDVQEGQVEWRASFSLGARVLECKFDTIPRKTGIAKQLVFRVWWGLAGLFIQTREEGNKHQYALSSVLSRQMMHDIDLKVQHLRHLRGTKLN